MEPQAVEAALREHPDVADAAVLLSIHAERTAQPCAYVSARGDVQLKAETLRAHLTRVLSPQLMSVAIQVIPRVPRLDDGSLDRAALLTGRSTGSAAPYARPTTDVERTLAEIWSSVLNVGRVGVHDNFFELGGTSMAALRCVGRIQDRLSLAISVKDVFALPTISQLAAFVDRLRWATAPLAASRETTAHETP